MTAATTVLGCFAMIPTGYLWVRGWLPWLTPVAPAAFAFMLGPWIGVSVARASAAWLGGLALSLGGLAFLHGWSLDGQALKLVGGALFLTSFCTALVFVLNRRQRSGGTLDPNAKGPTDTTGDLSRTPASR